MYFIMMQKLALFIGLRCDESILMQYKGNKEIQLHYDAQNLFLTSLLIQPTVFLIEVNQLRQAYEFLALN